MNEDHLLEYLHMEIVNHFCQGSDTDIQLNGAIEKLERLGFTVGQKFVERATKEIHRFKDELDAMKFICKDVWMAVYKKQIDNLRTNHHGIYNLHDVRFRFLEQMSSSSQYMEHAPKLLAFPCGLLRGALTNLGYNCVVTSEITSMPSCKFFIQILHS